MASSIENRIVQMQFDNASFENKLSETMRSLDKFNTTIANLGAKNGLSEVSEAAGRFHLGPMTTAIEGVSAKFLALSTIAVTALSTITSSAITAGTKIISAMSLDPVMSGFSEYQTQIGAIQTILSNTDSKGTSLDQVNSALDQLNEYSDKTIYNFTEMTKNIGTFTAAGVDLDTSVQSIKGIANIAAISGSSSQQASTAMYQLSQAIATGSVKLMDWNSVVNAGMGGEIFQKALFDTGVAMQTITDVPVGTSFEDWTKAGNTFRGSLESGWLSADVLTATLSQFTGELTKEQIMAQGFTEGQADEILRLGTIGVDAATKVRTLKQLLDTTKEALGSGWSQSFRTIFGDFEQATELFTNVSNGLGAIISRGADARNALLEGWSNLGGRTELIAGLYTAFKALSAILAPIKEAFREIFPPLTAERLMELTMTFRELATAMMPSETTVANLKRIFVGFFGALDIGWEIVKEGAKFIGELLQSFTGAGSGGFLDFAAKIGDFFADLSEKLVVSGRIAHFFDDLPGKIQPVIDKIIEFKDKALELFDKFVAGIGPVVEAIKGVVDGIKDFVTEIGQGGMDVAGEAASRFSDRFGGIKDALSNVTDLWGPFGDALQKVSEVLDKCWETIKTWFQELGTKLSAVYGPGDFDTALDALNVGLLGGIVALLAKFFKNGLKLDFGNGFFSGVTDTLNEVTGTLKAMQTDIKANALLKIASALGILTASIVVLSLIDSAALTKSMTAMAIGFGQLVGTFAILNTMASGPKGATSLSIMAAGLILLASALLVMSIAMKVMATMNWEELGKGLAGTAALLTMLVVVSKTLGGSAASMIGAGLGMIGIGIGLSILAGAVKLFSGFSWEDMIKGFAGVAAGLLIVALAMRLMPNNMILTAAGLLVVSTSLLILSAGIKSFSDMSWSEMARGMVGLAGGLLIIAGAMQLMPANMLLTAAGLFVVGLSLGRIADAVGQFGGMSWSEIGKGLVGLGGALLVLAAGAYAMSGAVVGAVAIGLMAISLGALVDVIQELAKMKVGDIVKGLVALAAVFGVLALAGLALAPAVGGLLAFGAALILIGAGFALFGAGAALLATAFETIGRVGSGAIGTLVKIIDVVIDKIPALITAFAEGMVQLAQVFLDAAPLLIDGLGVVIDHIIDTLITLLPKFGELLKQVIQTLFDVLREYIPKLIELGLEMITALLTGIRDHIGEVVSLALEIITNFIQGITDSIPQLVEAVANLITTFIDSIASHLGEIIESGVNLLVSFLQGISDNISKVTTAVGEVVTAFIRAVVGLYGDIIDAGFDALVKFIGGISDNLSEVTTAVAGLISEFVRSVGSGANQIIQAGTDTIVKFVQGIGNAATRVTLTIAFMMIDLIRTIGNSAGAVVVAGAQTIVAFIAGIAGATSYVVTSAFQILIAFINGLASAINQYSGQLRQAGINLASSIINGLSFGLSSKAGEVIDKARSIGESIVSTLANPLKLLGGPSRTMMTIGGYAMEGLAMGIERDNHVVRALDSQFDSVTKVVSNALDKLTLSMSDMAQMNPTITPVLDLTQVERDAMLIGGMMSSATITPTMSSEQAQNIASTATEIATTTASNATTPAGINFEQNIYAPEQLSTSDIYKQTRTQLTMVKEELSIP